MQSKYFKLENILKEFNLDELEYIVFKDNRVFDSFLNVGQLEYIEVPKRTSEKKKSTSQLRYN